MSRIRDGQGADEHTPCGSGSSERCRTVGSVDLPHFPMSLVGVVPMIKFYKRREAIDACDPQRFVPQNWAGRTRSTIDFCLFHRPPTGAVPVAVEPVARQPVNCGRPGEAT